MANMADVTIVKADGTTNVTFTALTPSAGDTTPARWAQNATETVANLRPTAEMRARYNGNRSARHVSVVTKFPEVVTVDGVKVVRGIVPFTTDGVIPLQVDDAWINEAVAQHANFFKAALIQAAAKSGYAPQ